MKSATVVSSAVEYLVAPLAGAWIEMGVTLAESLAALSPPSRGRGLKCPLGKAAGVAVKVAPLAGAWIEIRQRVSGGGRPRCRPPRGGRGLKSL